MILIVNTTENKEITSRISEELKSKNITFEIMETADKKIGHCIGCNYCWLKTPGICSVKDDYEEILKKLVNSDQLWVISNTALGFIDHKGKNIIDRIIPLATMHLYFKKKQMRHVLRYKKHTDVGFVYIGEADREYLNKWSERVAVNFGSKSLGAFPKEDWKEAAACMY
ncbi:MAG: flavodoxin family protein [Clostridiales bacterium]|nr:flavodoxin family protein [Clostridiales bacterium]